MKKMENINEALNLKKGPLSNEQIASAMHFCYCNAEELFEEAKILLQKRKLARAFGLCVLSLEELAKIPLLINGIFLKETDSETWKKFWRAFSSHKLKQNTWLFYGKQQFDGTEREKYYKHSYSSKLPSLEIMKQLSFYVDFINGNAMKPDILFEHMKGLIGLVLKMAEDRLEAFRPLHSTMAKSRKVVAFASRIKITGLSEKELQDKLFESIDAITKFCEKK
jgi:AbiV family abortive infection protein